MRSSSNDKPPILQDLGDGSWYYNYDIKEVEGDEDRTYYEYETIHFMGNPSYELIVSTLIRCRYSIDEELSILRQRDSKIERFTEYNLFCEDVKKMVKQDVKQ